MKKHKTVRVPIWLDVEYSFDSDSKEVYVDRITTDSILKSCMIEHDGECVLFVDKQMTREIEREILRFEL